MQSHKEFNSWLLEPADQEFTLPMKLINTSDNLPHDVAVQIKEYISSVMG